MKRIFLFQALYVDPGGVHTLYVNLIPAGDDHYYECFIGATLQVNLYIDDHGNWMDVEFGETDMAYEVGSMIATYQIKHNGYK
jgi:hypothetical protein